MILRLGGVGPDQLPTSLADAVASDVAGWQTTRIDGAAAMAVGVPLPGVTSRYFELTAMDDVDRTLDGLARGLAGGAVLATAAAAGVGWYASGQVLCPLRRVSAAAEGIADGTLDTRLDAVGDPDLEPFQRSFNRMADAVQERIDREIRFSSDVSHELRSPLAAMLSSVEIAQRHCGDPAAADEAMTHLRWQTEDFRRLVLDLLEISRADADAVELQIEALNPSELIEAVLAARAGDEITVAVLGRAPTLVHADKRRVGQMVMNLLDNADRYGGGANRVEVSGEDDGRL